MSQQDVSDRIRRMAVQRLESLARSGVKQLARREPIPLEPAPSNPPPQASTAVQDAAVQESPAAPTSKAAPTTAPEPHEPMTKTRPANKEAALAVVQQEVAACTLCKELASTRTQTVFGVGDPNARLCFFGEAPGADEDRQGEPFVGRAGKLLTDIIEKGMGLRRSDVYIMNILKCRPPGNRNPNLDEVNNCRDFFERQFEIIMPEFICCLGSVAAQNLLETKTPVGRLRGKIHDYKGVKVVVTYHPSYLLRNPSAKKNTWEDIKLLMNEMGIPVPSKSS